MIRLQTLGALDLTNAEGSELRAIVAQPKRLALLTYLGVATPHGFHRRDSLLPLFWPERDTEHARASLSRAIYFLRRELGAGVVVNRGSEEIDLCRDRVWCDVAAFDDALRANKYRDALDLYRGELLPGFFVSGAPGFEEWLEIQRARLRDEASAAAWNLSKELEAAGDFAAAANWARRGVELAPFSEAAFRRFLTLLDRSGDRAAAVHAYAKFADDIARELDMSPSAETRLLIESISSRASDVRELENTIRVERVKTADARDTNAVGATADGETDVAPVHETTSGAPNVPPARWRLRPRAIFIGAAAAAAITLVNVVRIAADQRPVDASRVEVAWWINGTGDPSLDRIGVNAAEQLIAAIRKTGVVNDAHLAGAPSSERAAMVVTGDFSRAGNALVFHVSITDARRPGKPWSLAPITARVEAAEQALDSARPRVIGAIAALRHPMHAALFPLATSPPTYEAYQEFLEGMTLQSQGRIIDALAKYRVAAAIDSTFTWSLVHAAMTSLYWYRADIRVHTDSLLTSLRLVHDRLTPLQADLVGHMQAVRAEDWVASYRAMRAASEIAPRQYLYTFAGKANQVNRPREAADALMRLGGDSVYQRSIQGYWRMLTSSLHQLGQHNTELATARRARDLDRHSVSALVQELKALSALGRLPEVRSGLDTLFSLPRDGWLTPGYAAALVAIDLRAHGHRSDAATAMQRALAWYRSRPAIEQAGQEWREWFAEVLYFAEDWTAADTAYRSLLADFPTSVGYPDNATYLGHIGAIAVRRGDLATAKAMSDRLVATDRFQPLPGQESRVFRARIAALIGDRAEAMRLLLAAYGPSGTMELHDDIDFGGMRDYAPFREFVRPKA